MAEKKNAGTVDLLHGSIMKSLVIFMIPILISSAFQQLYNAVDTAIVGNVLGETSLAAIGSCSSVYELLVGFCMSLGTGFSIVAGRSYGSGDKALIKKTVAGSLVIGVITSIALTLLSFVALKPLLLLINTPQAILEESYSYIHVIALGLIIMFAYNLCSAMLRAIGNSIVPLVFLVFSSILNVFLDLFLIRNLGMGVRGAAVATVLAQLVSVILCLIYIFVKTKELVPSASDFACGKQLYKELAGQGFAMAAMGSIVSCGSIILQSGINNLGEEIIAGHVAARKVYALFNLPFMAMAQAVSVFISQNRGAGYGSRILECMKQNAIYDAVMAVIVTIILVLFGRTFIHWISGSNNEIILSNGAMYLRIVGPFYCALGILISTRSALQGIGSKMIPLISSAIEFVGKILFTWIFIPKFGYMAVVFCEPIIWIIMMLQLLYSWNHNPYIQSIQKEQKSA